MRGPLSHQRRGAPHCIVTLVTLFTFLSTNTSPLARTLDNKMLIDNLTFSCINCNSLNMSSSSKILQQTKLYGTAKLKTDIIFLADIRLSNRSLISNANNISNVFRTNPYASYRFLYNSSQNKRGTGILINNKINFLELARRSDPDENYLLVMAEIQGKTLILGSVYGPNSHNNNFFVSLQRDIAAFGAHPIVLGGDWNCTVSCNNIDTNPDCLNMANPPSLRHSNYLSLLCNELDLLDPYRALHPFRKDFTYSPRAVGLSNRSRIDFFLLSRNLIPAVTSCEISPNLQNRLFDHKAVFLSFIPKKNLKNNRVSISAEILYDEDIEIVVKTAIVECYLHHIDMNRNINFNRELHLLYCGRIWSLLREAGSAHSVQLGEPGGEERFIHRQACLDDIRLILNLINIEELQLRPLLHSDDVFFDVLLISIKNEVSSYQNFASKVKKKIKNDLIEQINNCKNTAPLNSTELSNLEGKLNAICENELKIELEKSPVFDHLHNEKLSPVFLKLGKANNSGAVLSDFYR